jgi:hypothetical protein
MVDYIVFKATGNTAAGTLRIFYSANNSASWTLIDEITTGGVTASGTVPAEIQIWKPRLGSFPLPASSGIKFNVNNTENWNVAAIGGNF